MKDYEKTTMWKMVKERYDYHARHDTLQRLEFAEGHKCALEKAEYHRGWKEACAMVMQEIEHPQGSLFE